MLEFPAQFGLSAQSGDDWANILFVAVMAILWLVGALVKALSKKASSAKQSGQENAPKVRRLPGESWQERLARKAEEMQRRIEEEAGLREPGQPARPARPPVPRAPQAPGGKITVRPGPKGESIMVYEPPPPQLSTERKHQAARQREAQQAVAAAGQYAAKQAPPVEIPIAINVPKLEPAAGELSSVTAESSKPQEPAELLRKAAPEPPGFEVTALFDSSDPDALKKAILHYEIFGRPVGFRDAPDQTSLMS